MGLFTAIREQVKDATGLNRSLESETTVSIMMRPLVYIAYYVVFGAIAFRGINTYFSDDLEKQWPASALLLAFLLLSLGAYWLTIHLRWYPHLYMLLQGGLALSLLLLPLHFDYFSILCFLLSAQAMLLFPQRIAYVWLGIFVAAMAGALLGTGDWREAFPLIFLYGSGIYFFGLFATLTARSVAARGELQKAHSQLQEYAYQAEELAATKERNRLARDLHDSVTQSIFSITLTAESARILLERDHTKVAPQLERLQDLAQDSLAEMRSMIHQLRTTDGETEHLVPAIRQHLAALKDREGLYVEFQMEGDGQVPSSQREMLLRIVQEALNNVSKHAQTDAAEVTLKLLDGKALLVIEDQGVGFDPDSVEARDGHLGLASIRERTELQGGTLSIESSPGAGTRIMIEVPYKLVANPRMDLRTPAEGT